MTKDKTEKFIHHWSNVHHVISAEAVTGFGHYAKITSQSSADLKKLFFKASEQQYGREEELH